MSKKKSNKIVTVFNIFFKCIKLYFMYLDKTSKYLFLPIFGQVIGFFLILSVSYYYNTNIHNLRKFSFFNNDENILWGLIIVIFPFLLLFMHSFYRYLIAFCSLNIVFYTLSPKKTTRAIDFVACDNIIQQKLFQYIILMFIISILCLFPPSWLFLCLAFQIFSLEKDNNCFNAVSRSITLAAENLLSVILMLILVYIFSYWFLPNLFIWALEKISLVDFFVTRTEIYLQFLPYRTYNEILGLFNMNIDSVTIAKLLIKCALMYIIIGFTLPFRCACFSELYRTLDNDKIKTLSKEDEEIIKRASSKKRKKK